ncbi:MAG: hypothetical protein LBH59_00675 [Planctomycetaceae bacterium]|nr:hypothetical protein [Planctomycetaceae bacterium]
MKHFRNQIKLNSKNQIKPTIIIPKPVWAVGFALEQTLHVVTLAVFSYVDFSITKLK